MPFWPQKRPSRTGYTPAAAGGAFDVLAWADEGVLFADAKHGGKDALRRSQRAWTEAALDEGVLLGSLLVVEWRFGSEAGMPVGGHTTEG